MRQKFGAFVLDAALNRYSLLFLLEIPNPRKMFTVEILNVCSISFLSRDFKIIGCWIIFISWFEKQFFGKISRFLENSSGFLGNSEKIITEIRRNSANATTEQIFEYKISQKNFLLRISPDFWEKVRKVLLVRKYFNLLDPCAAPLGYRHRSFFW